MWYAFYNYSIDRNCFAILLYCDREHIVWKKKGTVSQIAFLGTSDSLSTENNILVVALLLEASKVRAKFKGYNGTIVSGANPLIIVILSIYHNYFINYFHFLINLKQANTVTHKLT